MDDDTFFTWRSVVIGVSSAAGLYGLMYLMCWVIVWLDKVFGLS